MTRAERDRLAAFARLAEGFKTNLTTARQNAPHPAPQPTPPVTPPSTPPRAA